ncbi:MAG: GFA family protein [Alphaproteobacteria bacterium]
MAGEIHSGGCMCGAVRFRGEGAPVRVGLCHCETCRRNTGTMFLTFAVFPRDRLVIEAGETGYLQSSPEGRRHFCRDCGSPVFSEWSDSDSFDVYLGSLDDPHTLRPTYELLWGGRAPWLADMPDLLRFERHLPSGVETPGKEA